MWITLALWLYTLALVTIVPFELVAATRGQTDWYRVVIALLLLPPWPLTAYKVFTSAKLPEEPKWEVHQLLNVLALGAITNIWTRALVDLGACSAGEVSSCGASVFFVDALLCGWLIVCVLLHGFHFSVFSYWAMRRRCPPPTTITGGIDGLDPTVMGPRLSLLLCLLVVFSGWILYLIPMFFSTVPYVDFGFSLPIVLALGYGLYLMSYPMNVRLACLWQLPIGCWLFVVGPFGLQVCLALIRAGSLALCGLADHDAACWYGSYVVGVLVFVLNLAIAVLLALEVWLIRHLARALARQTAD
jgi:hypothetical protein